MKFYIYSFLVFCVSTAYAGELADLSLEDLMNVKVTAVSKKDEELTSTPSNITIITRKRIEELGARNLKDIMRKVPGFQVIPDRDEWIFASRGNVSDNNNKYLILIDGKRMNSTENFGPGQIIEEPFDVSMIKQIEIIRGPGSSVWGADALAGVIYITTLDASDIENTGVASVAVGSQSTYRSTLKYAHKISEDANSLIMFNHAQSAGKNIYQDRPNSSFAQPSTRHTDIPTYLDRHAPSYNIYSKTKVGKTRLNAFHFNTRTYNRQFENDQGRRMDLVTEKSFIEAIHQVKENLRWRVYWHANSSSYQPQPGSIGKLIIWKDSGVGFALDASNVLNELWSFNYGFEGVVDKQGPNINSNNFNPMGTGTASETPNVISQQNNSDETFSSYLNSEFKPTDKWKIVLGTRADYNNDRGSSGTQLAITPRTAIIHNINRRHTLKLIYNQGFLRPSNFINTSKPANQDSVKPEVMRQIEAQWLWLGDDYSLVTTLFAQRLSGFINIKADQSQFLNAGDYESKGAEIEVEKKLGPHSLWFNSSYSDAKGVNYKSSIAQGGRRISKDGGLLSYAPLTSNIGYTHQLNKISINPSISFIAPTKYRRGPNTALATDLNNQSLFKEDKTNAIYLLNLNIIHALNDSWKLNLYLDNILDVRGPTHSTVWNGRTQLYGRYIEGKISYNF